MACFNFSNELRTNRERTERISPVYKKDFSEKIRIKKEQKYANKKRNSDTIKKHFRRKILTKDNN